MFNSYSYIRSTCCFCLGNCFPLLREKSSRDNQFLLQIFNAPGTFSTTKLNIKCSSHQCPSTSLAEKYDSWLSLVGDGVAQNSDLVDLSFRKVFFIKASERHSCMKDALLWFFGNSLAVSRSLYTQLFSKPFWKD